MFLATACAGRETSPTVSPLPPTAPALPTNTPVPPVDLTPAQVAALSALSEALGLPLDQIKILSTEAVEWPDACLGVSRLNVACAQVITPGFRIVLEANRLQYEYHTTQDGAQVVSASLALTWHREGGIAGFCDDLQIYLAGEVLGSSCKNGDVYPPGQLTADELRQLTTWVTSFGAVVLESKDPAVADAMTLRLTLNGSGSGQPAEADKTALYTWAQTIYDKVKPCC